MLYLSRVLSHAQSHLIFTRTLWSYSCGHLEHRFDRKRKEDQVHPWHFYLAGYRDPAWAAKSAPSQLQISGLPEGSALEQGGEDSRTTPSRCLLAELGSRESEDDSTVILGCLCHILLPAHRAPRGSLYLGKASSLDICTHWGTWWGRGGCLALAPGGLRIRRSRQTSGTSDTQRPTKQKADRGPLCRQDPHPYFTLGQLLSACLLPPPTEQLALQPSTTTNSTLWRDRREIQEFGKKLPKEAWLPKILH